MDDELIYKTTLPKNPAFHNLNWLKMCAERGVHVTMIFKREEDAEKWFEEVKKQLATNHKDL